MMLIDWSTSWFPSFTLSNVMFTQSPDTQVESPETPSRKSSGATTPSPTPGVAVPTWRSCVVYTACARWATDSTSWVGTTSEAAATTTTSWAASITARRPASGRLWRRCHGVKATLASRCLTGRSTWWGGIPGTAGAWWTLCRSMIRKTTRGTESSTCWSLWGGFVPAPWQFTCRRGLWTRRRSRTVLYRRLRADKHQRPGGFLYLPPLHLKKREKQEIMWVEKVTDVRSWKLASTCFYRTVHHLKRHSVTSFFLPNQLFLLSLVYHFLLGKLCQSDF